MKGLLLAAAVFTLHVSGVFASEFECGRAQEVSRLVELHMAKPFRSSSPEFQKMREFFRGVAEEALKGEDARVRLLKSFQGCIKASHIAPQLRAA